MPNPNPKQTEEFKKHWFKPVGECPPEKLERTPVAVTVGKSIYGAIQKLDRPERITWLRRVITEAAKRELLEPPPPGTVSENATPPAAPGSPPLDADTLGRVLTEVLAVPRLPAATKAKIQRLLEQISSR